MPSTTDLNLNVAHCLRTVDDFGGSTVRNICNGAETFVPWGSLQWALCIGLGTLGLAIILMFVGMALTIIRDRY